MNIFSSYTYSYLPLSHENKIGTTEIQSYTLCILYYASKKFILICEKEENNTNITYAFYHK